VICLDLQWEDEIAFASSENPAAVGGPRNGAYLIYTSGSTGKPKGVLVEHHGFTQMIRDQIERFGVRADDRGLQFSNISFDASIGELFLALLVGACVVPVPREVAADAEAFLRFLERHRITMATLLPSFLRSVGYQAVAPLRLLITAGEAAAPEICLEAARTGRCVNAYGPTEASVCAAYHWVKVDSDYRFGVPLGQPVGASQLYVLDASLNPMPIGVPGELCIGGTGVARGYLNRPDLTGAAFVPDPFGRNPGSRLYRTGDLARWRPDGEIEFLGRKDSQVKVRGHRIELGEVEAALNRLSGVRESVAMVRPGPDGSQRLMAYVIATNGPIAESALRAQLRGKLPDSLIPDLIVELATFPLTAAGKIDRKALPAPESAGRVAAAPIEPRCNVERVLAGIFASVVGRKHVGLRDSFFDLGGNSLMATQTVSRIRDLLRVELSVPVLFESPSIEELAARLLRDEQIPGEMEKIATALLKFEKLSKEERANLLARVRE
jgi:amino acid adenylation domain-containing protein